MSTSAQYTRVRYFIWLKSGEVYDAQPSTGFASVALAERYVARHTMLASGRYFIQCVHLQAS